MTDAPKLLNADDVRAMLREACEKAGSQTAWCAEHGFTNPFVCMVLKGRAQPTTRIASALGLIPVGRSRGRNLIRKFAIDAEPGCV